MSGDQREEPYMKNWNVIVSIYQDGFKRALRALREFGSVGHTPYHNILVMAVENPLALLNSVEQRAKERPALYDAISRVAPAMRSFEFQSAEEFRKKPNQLYSNGRRNWLDSRFMCVSTAVVRRMTCGRRTSSVFSTMRCSRRCGAQELRARCHFPIQTP